MTITELEALRSEYRQLKSEYKEMTGLNDFNQAVRDQLELCELPSTPHNWVEQAQYIVEIEHSQASEEWEPDLEWRQYLR